MHETPYTIRQATPADFPAINRLCVDAYREFAAALDPADWEQMHAALAHASDLSSAGELLLAEDATGVLGVILYVPPGKSDGAYIPRRWASLRMLAVAPRCRGRGVGRGLTQACIKQAHGDQAEVIGLTTTDLMKTAQAMYERMGFEKEAELAPRFGVNHARYALRLRLLSDDLHQ